MNYFWDGDSPSRIDVRNERMKEFIMKGLSWLEKGKRGDVNDAERLRKQLYSMRKLIEVIAEQPNGKQTTAVYTIEGQIGYKVFTAISEKFILCFQAFRTIDKSSRSFSISEIRYVSRELWRFVTVKVKVEIERYFYIPFSGYKISS